MSDQPAIAGPRPKECALCSASFPCGAGTSAAGDCWCNHAPPLMVLIPGADCLCPRCLQAAVERERA